MMSIPESIRKRMVEIYDEEHEQIQRFLFLAKRNVEMLGQLSLEYKPFLKGKRFISDLMLSERLGISRRTLQDFRDRGVIPFYRLDGKVLYEESDIEKYLESIYVARY